MNYNKRRQRNIIMIVKRKKKAPVNNASENLQILLTIEIFFVCDFGKPSCNVAKANVVLIPCHSGGSNSVFTARNRHFSASGGHFAALLRISPYPEKTHFSG